MKSTTETWVSASGGRPAVRRSVQPEGIDELVHGSMVAPDYYYQPGPKVLARP